MEPKRTFSDSLVGILFHFASAVVTERRQGKKGKSTWGHVKRRTTAKIGGIIVGRRKSKVGQLDGQSVVCHQDVLRLQVPVVNPNGVAELNGIQNLEKSTLGKKIVPNKMTALGDIGEQVALGTKFKHNKGAINGVHDADQGDHIGMVAGQVVQLDLPLLELPLPLVESCLGEGLDCIWDVGLDIDSGIHNSIGTNAENAGELQPVRKKQS